MDWTRKIMADSDSAPPKILKSIYTFEKWGMADKRN